MISTGGTIEAASRALAAAGSLPVSAIAATHGLFAADALQRLAEVGPRRLIVTDSLPAPASSGLPIEIVPIGPLLARTIGHLHEDRSLEDLVAQA
jgi:ribose-phosphate pyrophosphokinase